MKHDQSTTRPVVQVIVAVCAHCKRIRNHHGSWTAAETVMTPADAVFSHGICSVCGPVLYPELYEAAPTGE